MAYAYGSAPPVLLSHSQVGLASWLLQKLECINDEERPQTWNTLQELLMPTSGKVVAHADPLEILQCVAQHAAGQDVDLVTIPVAHKKRHIFDINGMNETVWNACENRANAKNMQVVCVPRESDVGNRIESKIKEWIDQQILSWGNRRGSDESSKVTRTFIQKLKRSFMETYLSSAFSSTEVALDTSVKNLYETYVIEKTGVTSKGSHEVKMNFLPDCMLLVLEILLKINQRKWLNHITSGKATVGSDQWSNEGQSIWQDAIKEINEVIDKMKDKKPDNIGTSLKTWRLNQGVANLRYSRSASSDSSSSDHEGDIQKYIKYLGNGKTPAVESLTRIFNSLSLEMENLGVQQVKVPDQLSPEGALALWHLAKLGKAQPKTELAMRNSLKQICPFLYFVPIFPFQPISSEQSEDTVEQPWKVIEFTEVESEKLSFTTESLLKTLMAETEDLKITPTRSVKPGRKRRYYEIEIGGHQQRPADDQVKIGKVESLRKGSLEHADHLANVNSTVVVTAGEAEKMMILENVWSWIRIQQDYGNQEKSAMETEENEPSTNKCLLKEEALCRFQQLCTVVKELAPRKVEEALLGSGILRKDGTRVEYKENFNERVKQYVKAYEATEKFMKHDYSFLVLSLVQDTKKTKTKKNSDRNKRSRWDN